MGTTSIHPNLVVFDRDAPPEIERATVRYVACRENEAEARSQGHDRWALFADRLQEARLQLRAALMPHGIGFFAVGDRLVGLRTTVKGVKLSVRPRFVMIASQQMKGRLDGQKSDRRW